MINLVAKKTPVKIKARQVTLKLGPNLILDELNMDFQAGERIALVGTNGAGKSTLLRLLAGIYVPTQGDLEIKGGVGTLFSSTVGMNANLSARHNIADVARLYGIPRNKITKLTSDIMMFANLEDKADVPMRTYSNGMRARVGFGIATFMGADIYLIDEIFGVGDSHFRKKATSRLLELVSDTGILVFATHSEKLITKVCNRAIWLEQGKVIADGNTKDVMKLYNSKLIHKNK